MADKREPTIEENRIYALGLLRGVIPSSAYINNRGVPSILIPIATIEDILRALGEPIKIEYPGRKD